jgi:hypothetical protein
MDNDISAKISKEWDIAPETIEHYSSFFQGTIRPIVETNYLSHLVTTIENMVNKKRMIEFFRAMEDIQGVEINREQLRALCAGGTFRFYSIIKEPTNLKRRATTRYHPS